MRTSTSRNKSVAKFSCNKVFTNLEGKTERTIFRDVCETAWVVLWRSCVGDEMSFCCSITFSIFCSHKITTNSGVKHKYELEMQTSPSADRRAYLPVLDRHGNWTKRATREWDANRESWYFQHYIATKWQRLLMPPSRCAVRWTVAKVAVVRSQNDDKGLEGDR